MRRTCVIKLSLLFQTQDEETVDLHHVEEDKVTKWLERGVIDKQTAGILRETMALRKRSDELSKLVVSGI